MNKNLEIGSYAEFRETFSSITISDYVHAVAHLTNLHGDFIYQLFRLIWPQFMQIGNSIFIQEIYSSERYEEMLSNGDTELEIQYWLNLFETTELSDDLTLKQAHEIAKILEKTWNLKLKEEGLNSRVVAKIIEYPEFDEVYVGLVPTNR